MASKETFTQHLAHEVVQAVVHRERYGWARSRGDQGFAAEYLKEAEERRKGER